MYPLRPTSVPQHSNDSTGITDSILKSKDRSSFRSPLDRIREMSRPNHSLEARPHGPSAGQAAEANRSIGNVGNPFAQMGNANSRSQSSLPNALTASTAQVNTAQSPSPPPNSPRYPEAQPTWNQQPHSLPSQNTSTDMPVNNPEQAKSNVPASNAHFHQQQSNALPSSLPNQSKQQSNMMMMPQNPALFSEFNFQPQPNYKCIVFTQEALEEIRSLILKHQSINYFVSRYLEELVDRNESLRKWDSPELEQVYNSQPYHRDSITLYRKMVELRALMQQFKKEVNYSNKIAPMCPEAQQECQLIWTAMKAYYDRKVSDAEDISEGKITESLIIRSELYQQKKLRESQENLSDALSELTYLKDFKQKGLVPPSSAELGCGDFGVTYGYFDQTEAYRSQEVDYFYQLSKPAKPQITVIYTEPKKPQTKYRRVREEKQKQNKGKVIRQPKEEPTSAVIVFGATIIWQDCSCETYKTLKGLVELPSKPSTEAITRLVASHIKAKYSKYLRRDASWEFSKVKKVALSDSWEVKLRVKQRMINVPAPYTYSLQSVVTKYCLVEGLRINNPYGSVFWKGKVEVEKIDFSKEVVEIEKNGITCNESALNSPCQVTFYSLPLGIRKAKKDIIKERLYDHFATSVDRKGVCALEWVDWEQEHYAVGFKTFGDFEDSEDEDGEREQDHLNSELLKVQEECRVLKMKSEVILE